jgi:hypothetical protein
LLGDLGEEPTLVGVDVRKPLTELLEGLAAFGSHYCDNSRRAIAS